MSPFSKEDLRQKINRRIDVEIAAGHTVVTAWLVKAMLDGIAVPSPMRWKHDDDRKEALLVLHEGYRQIVGAVVRTRKDEEEAEESTVPVLPGFERLQTVYSIDRETRDGETEQRLVPIGQIEKEEFRRKIEQLRAMRGGLDRHIQEMELYYKQQWPDEGLAA
jgi:hypothetical protein